MTCQWHQDDDDREDTEAATKEGVAGSQNSHSQLDGSPVDDGKLQEKGGSEAGTSYLTQKEKKGTSGLTDKGVEEKGCVQLQTEKELHTETESQKEEVLQDLVVGSRVSVLYSDGTWYDGVVTALPADDPHRLSRWSVECDDDPVGVTTYVDPADVRVLLEECADVVQHSQNEVDDIKRPEQDPSTQAKPQHEEHGSYYKQINGVKYDRKLLEKADLLTSGRGDGRISKCDAEELWVDSQDGKGVTGTEACTLQYILDNYNCTDSGKAVLKTHLEHISPQALGERS